MFAVSKIGFAQKSRTDRARSARRFQANLELLNLDTESGTGESRARVRSTDLAAWIIVSKIVQPGGRAISYRPNFVDTAARDFRFDLWRPQ
jgi:hypothetical protein